MSNETSPLVGGDFAESFLMEARVEDWPNDFIFLVWSPGDGMLYRITARCVLEYHHVRTGIGRLGPPGDGIPLDNIYVTREDEYERWTDRFRLFAEEDPGLYNPKDRAICLELSSHLFGNRKWESRWDRNTGVLVVCRDVSVEEVPECSGPRPVVHRIPGGDT